VAILVVATVFAIGHWGGPRDSWTLLSFLLAGISYSLITLHWRNLWPCIFLHATFNLLVLLIATTSTYTSSSQIQLSAPGIASFVASVFLLAFVFGITRRGTRQNAAHV
ncbi:MAG: CPBP family intramembrane metalloprotease, partial [Betaproteobacteria bacterium]|nr:CPBP family intramembrane metalloprotease [Betaproteobacteria bacterium]